MKRRYSYIDCYRILNIEPGCSWDELRKAYRIQIQKWHPDRFPEESAEKLAADDKIKCITSANQQLVAYYRKQGRLPDPEAASTPSALPRPGRPVHNSTGPTPSQTPPIHSKKSSSPSLLPIFVLIAIVSYLVWNYTPYTHPPVATPKKTEPLKNESREATITNQQISPSAGSTANNKIISSNTAIKSNTDEFITYGSTVGAVISIQGPPTNQIGDTWFYGESEIYFLDGKVIGWRHMPGSTLKIFVDDSNIGKIR